MPKMLAVLVLAVALTVPFTAGPTPSAQMISAPEAPPPTDTLGVAVVALGCTSCRPRHTLGFEVSVFNPGAPLLVELKTGVRLPDGQIVSLRGRHEEVLLPNGVTVIPLFSGFVLPEGIPPGFYVFEAALLEPVLGVTLSRGDAEVLLAP